MAERKASFETAKTVMEKKTAYISHEDFHFLIMQLCE